MRFFFCSWQTFLFPFFNLCWILYADEASISVVPRISKTYAPIGETPTITVSTEINARLYAASAISPKGDLVYMVRKKPFNSKAITEFLEKMLKEIDQKLLIIWDGASIHHSAETKQWLSQCEEANRIHLVRQPSYSPELNADEQVWNHLKGSALKNTCSQNVNELKPKIIEGMEDLKKEPQKIKRFFQHPDRNSGCFTNWCICFTNSWNDTYTGFISV